MKNRTRTNTKKPNSQTRKLDTKMFSNTKKPLTDYQKFVAGQRNLAKEKLENINKLWENNKDKLIEELRDDMDVDIDELCLSFVAMDISS